MSTTKSEVMSTIGTNAMIAIESSQGKRIKNVQPIGETYTFHKRFGFVPEALVAGRVARRTRHGLKAGEAKAELCRFTLDATADGFSVEPISGCQAVKLAPDSWTLTTDRGEFKLRSIASAGDWTHAVVVPEAEESPLWKFGVLAFLFFAITLGAAWMFASPQKAVEPLVISQPVQVTVVAEKQIQKPVTVPSSAQILPQLTDARLQDKTAKRAIAQNLGFLGMLGKKNLKGAVGGMPTSLNASPGAGPGGKEGSGGEMLVGLGQGVRHATVGNTGVAGLGGVGTKGVGGGAGGYGNTMVGSGEGRALSSVAVSNDMILEGGLDRAVIQATIAKYLSQVRACYEEQLQSIPGLAGQVTIGFVISGAGDVASSKVDSSTLGNSKAETCIATKLKTWKFPKPLGGVNVKVNYPFLLRPVGT